MLEQKKLFRVEPTSKKYVLDTDAIQKLLTAVILNRTQSTNIELGLVGHAAYYDVKSKKKDIISKFKLSSIVEYSKKYGAADIMDFPKLSGLANVLYTEEDGLNIFEIDEKKDEVYFRWHSNLALAAMCDISLAAPFIKFDYIPVVEPSKKDQKKQEIKQKVPMVVTVEVPFKYEESYDPSAVHQFLEDNGLI